MRMLDSKKQKSNAVHCLPVPLLFYRFRSKCHEPRLDQLKDTGIAYLNFRLAGIDDDDKGFWWRKLELMHLFLISVSPPLPGYASKNRMPIESLPTKSQYPQETPLHQIRPFFAATTYFVKGWTGLRCHQRSAVLCLVFIHRRASTLENSPVIAVESTLRRRHCSRNDHFSQQRPHFVSG
jgi:hypothetical protein